MKWRDAQPEDLTPEAGQRRSFRIRFGPQDPEMANPPAEWPPVLRAIASHHRKIAERIQTETIYYAWTEAE
jgi:hypothetical protein